MYFFLSVISNEVRLRNILSLYLLLEVLCANPSWTLHINSEFFSLLYTAFEKTINKDFSLNPLSEVCNFRLILLILRYHIRSKSQDIRPAGTFEQREIFLHSNLVNRSTQLTTVNVTKYIPYGSSIL